MIRARPAAWSGGPCTGSPSTPRWTEWRCSASWPPSATWAGPRPSRRTGPGIAQIAAPIRDRGGFVVAAVGIEGRIGRLCDDRSRPRTPLVTEVVRTARAISRSWDTVAAMGDLVAALDQGTTSTRCMLFDTGGRMVSIAQREHRQHFPQPGWVEHDARRDLDDHPPGDHPGAARRRRRGRPARRHRGHQPAGDDRGLGPPHGPAGAARDRLAGHPYGRHAHRAGRRARPGHGLQAHRPAAGHLLLRPEAALDPGGAPGAGRSGGVGRPAVRHHGQLDRLEPDRGSRTAGCT